MLQMHRSCRQPCFNKQAGQASHSCRGMPAAKQASMRLTYVGQRDLLPSRNVTQCQNHRCGKGSQHVVSKGASWNVWCHGVAGRAQLQP